MTKGKFLENPKWDQEEYEYGDRGPLWVPYNLVMEAKKEFESILTLLKEPDMPNMTREFQVLLCLNEWKIKWFGDDESNGV